MSLWPRRREHTGTKIEVGVLGAAGIVGQQLVALLEAHPWFELSWLGGEEALRGKRYGELPWAVEGGMPTRAANLRFETPQPDGAPGLVFSTLDRSGADEVEKSFAAAGHFVFRTAPNFLTEPLVPLLVPEVNAQHVSLLDAQQQRRWKGGMIESPSWPTVLLAVVLAALGEFEVQRVVATVLRGRPLAEDGEVGAEEEGVEKEVANVLGQLEAQLIVPSPLRLSVQAADGGTSDVPSAMVSVEFAGRVRIEHVAEAFRDFSGAAQALRLPSAPRKPILFHEEIGSFRPALARGKGDLRVHVGRLGSCAALDYKFAVHGGNQGQGLAAALVLNAELVVARALSARWGGGAVKEDDRPGGERKSFREENPG